MPDIRVQDEQGTIHVFPDEATPEMIAKAMGVKPPAAPALQPPDAITQSRAQMASRVHPTPLFGPSKDAVQISSPFAEAKIDALLPQVPGMVKAIRKGALQAGGAAFGGELGSLAKGLPWLVRTLAGASGAGFGAGAGTLAGGGSAKEALATAAGTTATSAPLAGLGEFAANPQAQNYAASKLRWPATARQSQLGRPGTVKNILPSFLQRYALPEGIIPKGEVGTPTNPGQFMEVPPRLTNAQIEASPDPFTGQPRPQPATPELGSPENPGWYAKLPARMPKQIAPPPQRLPFLPQATPSNAPLGMATLPKGELPMGNQNPFSLMAPRPQATGSAQEPFEPLIFESPEEAAAHDIRMQNLQRQAKAAGTYHAAQGAAGKRTNLQQRIARKDASE